MEIKKRVVVLISGRGTNLEALIKFAENYEVVAVLSDKNAPGLAIAQTRQIPTQAIIRDQFTNRSEQRAAIFSAVRSYQPDLVLLAGFMMIVPQEYTDEFFGKLINIHPSLLPKFPGLDTHKRALEAGETVHGASTHFVDHGVDTGPLIAQAQCAVVPSDSPDTLAARVLALEHKLYPWTINNLASGDVKIEGREVKYSNSALESARTLQLATF